MSKSLSAMLPPWIPLAAGRHHITNFDAELARAAARVSRFAVHGRRLSTV
jgi:hypothetical protein